MKKLATTFALLLAALAVPAIADGVPNPGKSGPAQAVATPTAKPATKAESDQTRIDEPASFALLALGIVGLFVGRRAAQRKK